MSLLTVIQTISSLDERGIFYLKEVSKILCTELPINYILIGSLNIDKQSVNSLAFFKDGKDEGEFNYDLEHTPCDIVLSKDKELKCYPRNLETIFPKDDYIPQLCLNAYYGCPLYDNVGNLIGIIAIFNENESSPEEEKNIRETLLLIERLIGLELMQLKLINQLSHKERLTILGQKLSTISHEVANPLTVLLGGLGLINSIIEKEKLDFNLQKIMTNNLKAVDKIKSLMKEVLSFSKNIEQFDLVEIDVHRALESSIEFERDFSINSRVKIKQSLKAVNHSVLSSKGKIEQIVINLIINSIHSMKENEKKEISIETYNSDDDLVLLIKDNGYGVNPDIIDHIFDNYFTTKTENEGTGMGLSICKSLVVEMNGKISVKSKVGEGSEFKIELPVN